MKKKSIHNWWRRICWKFIGPLFIGKNYKVTVYDIMYFTDIFLPKENKNLEIIKGDIRDKKIRKIF